MRVFLCWSGDRSKAVAEVLGHWIGQVIQAVEPWISTQTDKGARWRTEIGDHLEEAKVGIACLTPENLDSPWIHFESGALSKTKDAHVFTFLLDLQPTDVKEPLAQFQATKAEEDDVRQLIRTINKLVGQTGGRTLLDSDLDEIFNHDWPRLKEKLGEISPRQIRETPFRPEGEMLQEILELVRGIEQSQYRGSHSGNHFLNITSPKTQMFKNLCLKIGSRRLTSLNPRTFIIYGHLRNMLKRGILKNIFGRPFE